MNTIQGSSAPTEIETVVPTLHMSDPAAFFADTAEELARAREVYGPMASAHEGWAVIAEELDELWEHVRFPMSQRNPESMRKECIQIAAMAARFAIELCDTGKVNER